MLGTADVSTRAHYPTNFVAISDVRKLSPRRNSGHCDVFIEPRRNDERGRREESTSPLGVFPRRNENVGSLTLAESRELDVGRTDGGETGEAEGEGVEARVVIYEVSKTLYTPTRQRAGLAPRNPVLALTHRYLSHDHFRPIRARGGVRTHTHVHGASSTLHAGVFTIYSAPRVGNAVGYLVDIVYLGYSPPHDPRDFSFRLSPRPPPVRKKRQRDDCLAPPPRFRGDKWSSGTYRH